MVHDFFRSFKLFSEDEIEEFLQLFEIRKVSKNEYFIQEGEKCREVAFIQSGIFRSFYLSDDGKDMTYCFRFPNTMMAAYSSFISGCLSKESMQAITDSELLILKKEQMDALVQDKLNWMKFLKIIAEQEYLELGKPFFPASERTVLLSVIRHFLKTIRIIFRKFHYNISLPILALLKDI